jgi:hypothetical protein
MKLISKANGFVQLQMFAAGPIVLLNQINKIYILAYASKNALRVVDLFPPHLPFHNFCARLYSQACNSLALGRRKIHSFFLQIQIAPNFGAAGKRVYMHDLLDSCAFLQSEPPRNIILCMALGRMLALTLQSPFIPLPYNPKLDSHSQRALNGQ